jgi:hypothetical protein
MLSTGVLSQRTSDGSPRPPARVRRYGTSRSPPGDAAPRVMALVVPDPHRTKAFEREFVTQTYLTEVLGPTQSDNSS